MIEPVIAQEILTFQYGEAIKLYIHEDQLNWEKLYNLFYVTLGLFGALGFSLSQRVRGPGYAILICLLGIVGSSGFLIANSSGVFYLKIRKDAVIRIEDKLRQFGGERIVNIEEIPSAILAPTRYVIYGAPIVIGGVWFVVLVIILKRREWFGLGDPEGDREEPAADDRELGGGPGESGHERKPRADTRTSDDTS